MSDRKEYIERETAVKIVRETAREHFGGYFSVSEINLVDSIIANMYKSSVADVVEVVRCRDCKHKVNFQNRIMCDRNARYSTVRSEWYGLTATDNDNYCSYGERKDGDK